MRDKVLEEILNEIKGKLDKILGKNYHMILFGSQARGDQADFSDVDIMIILNDKASNFEAKEKIRDIIYEFSLNTPYLFSILIVPESLARERKGFLVFKAIEEEGVAI